MQLAVPDAARHAGIVVHKMTSRPLQVSFPSKPKGTGHLARQSRTVQLAVPDAARHAGIVVHKMTSRPLQVSFPSKPKGTDPDELLTAFGQRRGTRESDGHTLNSDPSVSGKGPQEAAQTSPKRVRPKRGIVMAARSMPADVKLLSWAARQLFIADSTAYRLAPEIPGACKVGGQWRVSVPKFMHEVHGFDLDQYRAASVVEPQR